MRVAVISYNVFIPGEANGWKVHGDNSLLLLQGSGGEWNSAWSMETYEKWHEGITKSIVDPLWEQLQNEWKTIEKVVFYVGSYGAEQVIELAAKQGLAPNRAVFVFCDCNLNKKRDMIRSHGFSASKVVPSHCGGQATMKQIYNNALTRGVVPARLFSPT